MGGRYEMWVGRREGRGKGGGGRGRSRRESEGKYLSGEGFRDRDWDRVQSCLKGAEDYARL